MRILSIIICLLVSVGSCLAQSFPSRPIRVIVPYAAGGSTDIVARLVAVQLGEKLGQRVVVDNKPGGAGVIAMDALRQSPPDGHTLVMVDPSFLTNPLMQPQLNYRLNRDMKAITRFQTSDFILAVHPSLAVNDVQGLIRYAKDHPLNYYSTGVGSVQHLATELFRARTGFAATHVPYKGFPPALVDLLSGQVHFGFYTPSVVLPYLKDGRLRGLATTGVNRSLLAPDLPTFKEAGVNDFELNTWWAFGSAAGTPDSIVRALNNALLEVGKSADLRAELARLDMVVRTGTPEATVKLIDDEDGKSARLLKSLSLLGDK